AADKICELWMSVQSESLGPAIELKPGYETFWAYVPHFVHSPFYVYAYAFGDCLVNSLYAVYEKSAGGFAERYLAMLSAGGTKHHFELLAPFGLDARDPKFWDGGLNVIANLIDELEKMEGREWHCHALSVMPGFMPRGWTGLQARRRRLASFV